MRPDPGREPLEVRLAALSSQDRARIAVDLRARGFALAWDQLDRMAPLEPRGG